MQFFNNLHEGAALAYIGEKSRGIFFSSWDLTTPLPPQENFSPSRGILKMARVSPHFSSSRGIPRDEEKFSWGGGAPKHDPLDQRLKKTIPHPLHENISPSRGIPWDEEKWGEALTILKIADHTPPPPWEHLPISWDPTRWGETLTILKMTRIPGETWFLQNTL